ncbi:MAG: DUF1538 family protein, partial [Clostridia bacterium]|nr:DUF1538 family protein [Clostridia bacterium]
GVAISVGIAMIRALTGISIMIPLAIGYSIALILTFFVPDIFTSIAFDSGGVASGAMTSTFLLTFSIGACMGANGGSTVGVMTDAFGTVAMVAMTPLIAIQILGIVYKIRIKNVNKANVQELENALADEIVDVNEESFDKTLTIPIPIYIDNEIIDF